MADYSGLSNYQSAIGELQKNLPGATSQNVSDYSNQLNQHIDQFNTLFKNNVGRDATQDEQNQFISGYVVPNTNQLKDPNFTGNANNVRNGIAQYIGDTFQQQANDTATNKLSDLSSQAGSLADQYTSLANQSLSSLSDSLKSYQTSLFDKLRPQLNLAAQAGGYQDSGGQTLQEKGALTDLGNQAMAYLLPIQQKYQDNANAIRYGGASAPYSLASSFAANQPNVNASFGSGGLNFGDANAFANDNYQRQLQLMNAQRLNSELYQENTRPSFGQNLSSSFSTSLGSNLGKWFSPGGGSSGGGGGGSDLAALPGMG